MVKNKNKTAPGKPRTPKAVLEAELCELLSGKLSARLKQEAPPFPHKFRVVRPESGGAPIILKIEDNTARLVTPEYAAGYLREYLSYLGGTLSELNQTYSMCLGVVRSWSHQSVDLSELPKSVGFKSDPALCMTRLAFDPVEVTDLDSLKLHAPLFSEMLGRMENSDAFCMRVGSMFDPDADRKQAVWMSGPRDCGKSEFAWLLMELSGKGYGLLSNADFKTDYWKAQLVGKRVGLVQEAAAKFIRTDEFKSITGDDIHSINQKNQPIFHAQLPVLLFFFSNNPPEIPHDDALMARIIDCRIKAISPDAMLPKAVVRAKIIEELPYIAGYSLSRYRTISSGDRIPNCIDTLTETIARYEAEYIDFLDKHFIEDESGHVLRSKFKELMVMEGIKTSIDQSICKRVLLSRFRVKETRHEFRTNSDATSRRAFVYMGIRSRTECEKQFIDDMADRQDVMSASRLKNIPQHLKILT